MLAMPISSASRLYIKVFPFFCLLCSGLLHAQVIVPDNPTHAWQAPLASQSLLIALDVIEDQVYAVGERGHILSTAVSQPSQWNQASVDTQVLLNAIDMIDQQRGWAVGHDAVILATVDGGKHWKTRFQAMDEQRPLFDVWFHNSNYGIAVGAYGYLLSTRDGGTSWQAGMVHEEYDFHLNAITANGEGDLYIAAEAGHVYRSDDNGGSWQVLKPPYEGSFFDVEAFGDTVIVAGLRGHIYVSTDRGEQWRSLSSGVQTALTGITPLQNGKLLVVGHAGVVLLVDEALQSVTIHRLAGRSAISDAVEMSANQVMLVGEHGASLLNLCQVFASELSGGCE
jgi:photosystem II stability/assembly factor-like uncharacterized protein